MCKFHWGDQVFWFAAHRHWRRFLTPKAPVVFPGLQLYWHILCLWQLFFHIWVLLMQLSHVGNIINTPTHLRWIPWHRHFLWHTPLWILSGDYPDFSYVWKQLQWMISNWFAIDLFPLPSRGRLSRVWNAFTWIVGCFLCTFTQDRKTSPTTSKQVNHKRKENPQHFQEVAGYTLMNVKILD